MNSKELTLRMYNMGTPWPRIIQWVTYHKKNPHIWPAFEHQMLLEVRMAEAENKSYGSVKAAWERMRRDIEKSTNQEFAADNNYHALYGRAFVCKYSEYKDFFEFRNLIKDVA